MKVSRYLIYAITIFLLISTAVYGKGAAEWNIRTIDDTNLEKILPTDPSIRIGTLDNGLKFYIKKNTKPADRMVLRLALDAGSILEDEDQLGLAHFAEHMAFNGTENYEEHEIIDYLESIGMQFGPDINAHTGFDETVYKLNVSTEDKKVMETAFEILSEWAFRVSFEDEEIDKERGVIVEEWRLGRGAEARMMDEYFPVLFRGSQYAERLPIGDMDIVRNFSYDVIRRFYADWYRPDLMAVIAVGDFDPDEIETMIRKNFEKEEKRNNPRERKEYPVPDHKETLFSASTDPETANSVVQIFYKHRQQDFATYGDYRDLVIRRLLQYMFNSRLDELTREEEPPYIYAFSGNADFVRTKGLYYLAAVVDDGKIETGLDALFTEAMRIQKYGFTQTELNRAKQELMKRMETVYKERDKTESVLLATEYIRNFMADEPIPGIAFEWKFYQDYMPGITLEDIKDHYEPWLDEENRVVILTAPEKDDLDVPGEDQLRQVMTAAETRKVEQYRDVAAGDSLIDSMPIRGSVLSEDYYGETGVYEWKLSNGVTVVLKPTDFKNDEVLVTAFSPGGNSLVDDNDYISTLLAASIVQESGVGSFDRTQLEKYLAGKSVYAGPYIGELTEGFSGGASPEDLETMFQLIYLYAVGIREDEKVFTSLMSRYKGILRNQEADPGFLYQKELIKVLTNDDFRSRPLTSDSLDAADFDTALKVYQDRFRDFGDFTFVMAGAFSPEAIKPLVETYIASLPVTGRTESWLNRNPDLPEGIIKGDVKAGIEPKSRVSIVFSGMAVWSLEETFLLDAMADVLSIRLREKIREDESGTYGARVSASLERYPEEEYSVIISFGCDPERAQELIELVYEEIQTIISEPLDELYVTKVTEGLKKSYQEALERNSFWLNQLQQVYFNDLDQAIILEKEDLYDTLTPELVRETAALYLNMNNYVEYILYPEDFRE